MVADRNGRSQRKMNIMHHEEELDRTHVPLPVVHAAVDELGCKIHGRGSMVSAIGGDRARKKPHNEDWRPVYCRYNNRRCRWIPKAALGLISHDLCRKLPGEELSAAYPQKKRTADQYWAAHGGEAAKQVALAPNY